MDMGRNPGKSRVSRADRGRRGMGVPVSLAGETAARPVHDPQEIEGWRGWKLVPSTSRDFFVEETE